MRTIYMELYCAILINTRKLENYQHCIKATNLLPLAAPLTTKSLFLSIGLSLILPQLYLLSPLNPDKYDDFHIHMDYVILYGSMEGK